VNKKIEWLGGWLWTSKQLWTSTWQCPRAARVRKKNGRQWAGGEELVYRAQRWQLSLTEDAFTTSAPLRHSDMAMPCGTCSPAPGPATRMAEISVMDLLGDLKHCCGCVIADVGELP